jgi:hypothetical protein
METDGGCYKYVYVGKRERSLAFKKKICCPLNPMVFDTGENPTAIQYMGLREKSSWVIEFEISPDINYENFADGVNCFILNWVNQGDGDNQRIGNCVRWRYLDLHVGIGIGKYWDGTPDSYNECLGLVVFRCRVLWWIPRCKVTGYSNKLGFLDIPKNLLGAKPWYSEDSDIQPSEKYNTVFPLWGGSVNQEFASQCTVLFDKVFEIDCSRQSGVRQNEFVTAKRADSSNFSVRVDMSGLESVFLAERVSPYVENPGDSGKDMMGTAILVIEANAVNQGQLGVHRVRPPGIGYYLPQVWTYGCAELVYEDS